MSGPAELSEQAKAVCYSAFCSGVSPTTTWQEWWDENEAEIVALLAAAVSPVSVEGEDEREWTIARHADSFSKKGVLVGGADLQRGEIVTVVPKAASPSSPTGRDSGVCIYCGAEPSSPTGPTA